MKQMMYFGTLSKIAEEKGIEVTILSGDRDTFQLTSDHVTVRIPRTKAGKTEKVANPEIKIWVRNFFSTISAWTSCMMHM